MEDFRRGAHHAIAPRRYICSEQLLPRQLRCLLDPSDQLYFVKLVMLVDVEVADVLMLRLDGGKRTQRCGWVAM